MMDSRWTTDDGRALKTMDDGGRRSTVDRQCNRRIAVVDYGVGNLRNVYKALEAAGAPAEVVTSAGRRWQARPGSCCRGLARSETRQPTCARAGFEAPLEHAVQAGAPLLGICVGMQLLFDESEEMGRHAGLGIIPGPRGALRRRHARRRMDALLKVPQIGWNQLVPRSGPTICWPACLMAPTPISCIRTTAPRLTRLHRWRRPISASRMPRWSEAGNVWGIQCHPEKSQAVGLRILRNFISIVNG